MSAESGSCILDTEVILQVYIIATCAIHTNTKANFLRAGKQFKPIFFWCLVSLFLHIENYIQLNSSRFR